MGLIQKVKSNLANFWLTIFGVLILSPNVFYVFYKISVEMPWPYLREAQAAGVALYVSWSIVSNTMKGNLKIALRFAVFEVFISVCYYWLRLMFETGSFEWNWYIIPAFAFALMIPLSLKEGASYIKDEEVIPEPKDDFNYASKFAGLNTEEVFYNKEDYIKRLENDLSKELSKKSVVAPLVDPEFTKELEIKIEEFKALESEFGQMKYERDAAVALSNARAEELAKAQTDAKFYANNVRESGLTINQLTAEIEKLKSKSPDTFEVKVIEATDETDEWGK